MESVSYRSGLNISFDKLQPNDWVCINPETKQVLNTFPASFSLRALKQRFGNPLVILRKSSAEQIYHFEEACPPPSV